MTDYSTKKKLKTKITVLLDGSGSMESIRDKTIEGFNAYKKGIETLEGDVTMTVIIFDTVALKSFISDRNVKEVPDLSRHTYVPNAGTPLYNAIGETINHLDNVQKEHPEYDYNNLFVIITDGMNTENYGYTREQIFQMITDYQNKGWSFIYLGANQDAWSVGSSLGLNAGNVRNYNVKNIANAFVGTAAATRSYQSASLSGYAASGLVNTSESVFDDAGITEDAFVTTTKE